MKDYSTYTREDFQAMSNEEFEEFAKAEHKYYMDNLEWDDDKIPYGEFFTELSVMMGRQDSVRRFN